MRSKIFLILFLLAGTAFLAQSCSTSRSSTDKRIKKQRQRQKRNPGDCPRIDCSINYIPSNANS